MRFNLLLWTPKDLGYILKRLCIQQTVEIFLAIFKAHVLESAREKQTAKRRIGYIPEKPGFRV